MENAEGTGDREGFRRRIALTTRRTPLAKDGDPGPLEIQTQAILAEVIRCDG